VDRRLFTQAKEKDLDSRHQPSIQDARVEEGEKGEVVEDKAK